MPLITAPTSNSANSGVPSPECPPRPTSATRFRRTTSLLFVLIVGLALFLLVDISTDEAEVQAFVTPHVVLIVLGRHVPLVRNWFPPLPASRSYLEPIVWEQRLPRVLGGALVGMLLALAGVAFQGLLMNPLADPYTVGVSSGAALGSMAVILTGLEGLFAGCAQTFLAFLCGLLAVTTVYFLAMRNGRVSAQSFLLAGMSVGIFFWSLIPLMLSFVSGPQSMDRRTRLMAQLFGDLGSLHWWQVGALFLFGGVGGVILWISAPELDMMTLGEESAAGMGVDTESVKRRVIVAGSLVTAAAVSVAGIIAFVGLIVPHIARRMVGPGHRVLLPTAALLGGLLLVFADWLSRVFLHQLEVGIVTSLLGAPVFCYLLRRQLQAGK